MADGVVELPAEAANQVGDDGLVGLRDATVSEGVGEHLQSGAILLDGEMTLVQPVELLQRLHPLLVPVGTKQGVDRRVQDDGGRVVDADGVGDLLGDRAVEPTDDAPVDL
uniref:Uncharacterized protein n=1 Tax=Triticum urartu TaxID=4572 RepID=A0A8R7VEX5_TRIUA